MDDEYITFRNRPRSASINDSSTMFDCTMLDSSLPNIVNIQESEIIQEMNYTIKQLGDNLRSANQEIDNLTCENTKLKLDLEIANKIIELYKKV